MTDIAYYDIKSELRKNRLTNLKQLRIEQTKSLQKAISQRGKEENAILKDILTKNNSIINNETDDIQRIISHLIQLLNITKDITTHTNQDVLDITREIAQLKTRLP
jgi:hypothetical protein